MHPFAAFRPIATRVATDDVDLALKGVADCLAFAGIAAQLGAHGFEGGDPLEQFNAPDLGNPAGVVQAAGCAPNAKNAIGARLSSSSTVEHYCRREEFMADELIVGTKHGGSYQAALGSDMLRRLRIDGGCAMEPSVAIRVANPGRESFALRIPRGSDVEC